MVSMSRMYQLYTSLYANGWGRYYDISPNDGFRMPTQQSLDQEMRSEVGQTSLRKTFRSRAAEQRKQEEDMARQFGLDPQAANSSSELRTFFGGLGSM